MMPLWTTATPPASCGWALSWVGAPWVAQRVWPMPVVPASGCGGERPLEIGELALGAAALDPAVDQRRDPGAVVAAVLEPPQRVEQQRRRRLAAEDADDSAHRHELPWGEVTGRGRRRARSRAAPSAMSVWRPRAMLRLPGGTSRLIVLPAPTKAPSPIVTGATSAELEPMNTPSPISVRCLAKPS